MALVPLAACRSFAVAALIARSGFAAARRLPACLKTPL
jgi:hypothetical protein